MGKFNTDEVDGSISISGINIGSRKRKKTSAKNLEAKIKRYSAPAGLHDFIPCEHSNSKFQCSQIRHSDAKMLRDNLYKIPEKLHQDVFVSNLIQVNGVKRRRPRKTSTEKKYPTAGNHAFTVNYFIPSEVNEQRIHVCKELFISVTKIGRTRLSNIVKKVNESKPFSERRGGDRKSFKNLDKSKTIEFNFKLESS